MPVIFASFSFPSTFCLKPSNVTDRSGKTLLVSTPYSLKLALLDVIILYEGLEVAQSLFDDVRAMRIWWEGPSAISVTRVGVNFLNILNEYQTRHIYQEFCTYSGSVHFYFETETEDISYYLPAISRIGRSGSLVTCNEIRNVMDIPDTAVNLHQPLSGQQVSFGLVQRMDDMAPSAQFSEINTMNDIKQKKVRIQYDSAIPYRLTHSSYNHMLYERI